MGTVMGASDGGVNGYPTNDHPRNNGGLLFAPFIGVDGKRYPLNIFISKSKYEAPRVAEIPYSMSNSWSY
jgi:hypothetical protein